MSITAIAVGAALKSVFDRLAKTAGERGHAELQKRFVTKGLQNRIAKKIASLDKLRTVFSKQARLSEFYVPARFNDETRERFSIDSLDSVTGASLILGIAGQGKSVFLRHLAIKQADEGKYIPIFAELKRLGEVSEKETLWSFLLRTLERFDIPNEPESLALILHSGAALVLLDAFDELPIAQRERVAREIEDLVLRFPEAKIFVSSRPDTEIAHSPHLNQMSVADLSIEQRNLVIKKIYGSANTAEAKALQRALEQNENIAGVLKTPLIVALLTVTFNKDVFLPETLPKFYEQVFEAMLVQHDSAKMLTRPRKSKLSDTEFRQVFEAYCAICLQRNNLRFAKSIFLNNLSTALLDQRITTCTADSILSDVVGITCLIVKDGDAYEFIHKTILEYFASSFIAHLPEPRARAFYEGSFVKEAGWLWLAANLFLSELDKYRYAKYFQLPTLEKFLSLAPFEVLTKDRQISYEELEAVFGCMFIVLHERSDESPEGYSFETEKNHIPWSSAVQLQIGSPLFDAAISIVFQGSYPLEISQLIRVKGERNESGLLQINLREALLDQTMMASFLASATDRVKDLLSKRNTALSLLDCQEGQGEFLF